MILLASSPSLGPNAELKMKNLTKRMTSRGPDDLLNEFLKRKQLKQLQALPLNTIYTHLKKLMRHLKMKTVCV